MANSKKNDEVSADNAAQLVALQRRNKELQEKLEALEQEKNSGAEKPVSKAPKIEKGGDELTKLKAQVELLTNMVGQKDARQIVVNTAQKKFNPRSPVPEDFQEETVTFVARSVTYIVGSYMDAKGVEQMPPFKLIVFDYAGSDRRRDGREETLLNYCQYSTNFKPEIEFLRNHPYYGLSFSESLNGIMKDDVRDMQYRLLAMNSVSTMTPEAVMKAAEIEKIPNWRTMSVQQLRIALTIKKALEFKKSEDEIASGIQKRALLAAVSAENHNTE